MLQAPLPKPIGGNSNGSSVPHSNPGARRCEGSFIALLDGQDRRDLFPKAMQPLPHPSSSPTAPTWPVTGAEGGEVSDWRGLVPRHA